MVQILVMNSRHSNLYKKFESEGYANVLANMARLLSEEKEYEDKGNCGHLCNQNMESAEQESTTAVSA